MNNMKRIGSYLAVVLISLSMTSVAVAATQENPKFVLTKNIDETFSFRLMDLADPDLAWVLELVPEEWLEDPAIDPEALITVNLDGKVHVNALINEGAESTWAKVHLVWHGIIGVQIEGMPQMVLDLKNAQLLVEGYLPNGDLETMDMKVNFHINGVLTGDEVVEIDIGTHLLMQIQGGEITQFKIWVPELFCLAESS
jgi:hypothetical protein